MSFHAAAGFTPNLHPPETPSREIVKKFLDTGFENVRIAKIEEIQMVIVVPINAGEIREFAVRLAAQTELLRQRGDVEFAETLTEICRRLRKSASRMECPFVPQPEVLANKELDTKTA